MLYIKMEYVIFVQKYQYGKVISFGQTDHALNVHFVKMCLKGTI